jgi:hypothetical protein
MDLNNLFSIISGSTVLIVGITIACTVIPFLAIAVFLIYRARRSSGQAQSSQTWPSVIGTVVSSNTEARQSHDSDGTHTSFYPMVMYEYEVLGHRYRSDQVNFGGKLGYGNSNTAQVVVDRYIPGNNIRVYYNPNNPGEAVLERTAGTSSRILVWVAIFIIAILLCGLCITLIAVVVPLVGINEIFKSVPLIPTP